MEFTPTKTLKRARSLRRAQTEAERRLWLAVRGRRLQGLKFVRQEPVGPFIADFVCHVHKLVVELDGATHGEEADIAHDLARTGYLQSRGYRVLRFNNADVYENLIGVLDTILTAIR